MLQLSDNIQQLSKKMGPIVLLPIPIFKIHDLQTFIL